jgi:hypothetical protein
MVQRTKFTLRLFFLGIQFQEGTFSKLIAYQTVKKQKATKTPAGQNSGNLRGLIQE